MSHIIQILSAQVVICQNNVQKRSTCCNVLAHEFIHAFDSCRAKVDFENLHHLACTEVITVFKEEVL